MEIITKIWGVILCLFVLFAPILIPIIIVLITIFFVKKHYKDKYRQEMEVRLDEIRKSGYKE